MNKTLFLTTLITGIIVMLLFVSKKENASIQTRSIDSTATESTPTQDGIIEESETSEQIKFVSEKLGISFLYLSPQYGEEIKIEEDGDTIYVFSENYNRDAGQYVQIFSKDPEDSLVEAIEKQLLLNHSKNDCEALANEDTAMDYPENYEVANVRVAGEWADLGELFEKAEKCPANYTETNGMAFFLMDVNHPDKFAFFSIGQYGIAAVKDSNVMWQDTVEFF